MKIRIRLLCENRCTVAVVVDSIAWIPATCPTCGGRLEVQGGDVLAAPRARGAA